MQSQLSFDRIHQLKQILVLKIKKSFTDLVIHEQKELSLDAAVLAWCSNGGQVQEEELHPKTARTGRNNLLQELLQHRVISGTSLPHCFTVDTSTYTACFASTSICHPIAPDRHTGLACDLGVYAFRCKKDCISL